jgi:hypothetical protein
LGDFAYVKSVVGEVEVSSRKFGMMLAGAAPARNAKGLASSRKLGHRFPPDGAITWHSFPAGVLHAAAEESKRRML